MDIALVLEKIRPNTHWYVGDTYDSLVWLDENNNKPTYEEIQQAWIEIEYDLKAKAVRKKRDELLQNTDWVYIKYSEMGMQIPEEWKIYRQALRDITDSPEFPYEVSFPEEPKST